MSLPRDRESFLLVVVAVGSCGKHQDTAQRSRKYSSCIRLETAGKAEEKRRRIAPISAALFTRFFELVFIHSFSTELSAEVIGTGARASPPFAPPADHPESIDRSFRPSTSPSSDVCC